MLIHGSGGMASAVGLPWVDIDDNTVNMLIVPWPYAIKPTWFKPSSWTTNRKGSEQTRFFEYTGGGGENPFRFEYLQESCSMMPNSRSTAFI